jgi:hypothetical protein
MDDAPFLLARRREMFVEIFGRKKMTMRAGVRVADTGDEAIELGLMIVTQRYRNSDQSIWSPPSGVGVREIAG